MSLEECERSRAGESRCICVVAGTHVAVESVARVFVPVDLHIGVSSVDLLYLLGRNVRVEFTEVKLHGSEGSFLCIVANAPGIVADCRIRLQTRRA